MLQRKYLVRKLKRYRPYSRERVLEAIDFAEKWSRDVHYANTYSFSYITTTLRILAERARTQLNSEAPEGMEWKLMKKGSRSIEWHGSRIEPHPFSDFASHRLGFEFGGASYSRERPQKIRLHVEFL